MQILKDNYGKVIFGVLLLCLVIVLGALNGGVTEAREFVASNSLETLMSDNKEMTLVYPKNVNLLDVTLSAVTSNRWLHHNTAGFVFGRYIYCSKASCGRLNHFSAKACYDCGTDLGLSSEEKAMAFLEAQKHQDGDEDGIINGLEELYEFMDKSNKNDAYLDFDGDGFANLAEITAGKNIEEQIEMLKKKQSFVFDPEVATSHPPLADLLRVKSLNQAREMGVTLKSVNEIESDKKSWEVAFNIVSRSGRRETIWRKIGESLKANNGMTFEIIGIEKTTKEVYIKSVHAKRTISTYLVEAKTPSGDIYHIKSKLFEKQGSKIVQFVYLNQPFYKNLVPIKVIMNENFMLTLSVKGKILDKVQYQLVGIKDSVAEIKQLDTNKKFEINKISRADMIYLKKRALAEKNK
jgi:hypothetical protein